MQRINIARGNHLKASDNMGTNNNWIHGDMRHGCVATLTLDRDGKYICGRHDRAFADCKLTNSKARQIVHAIDLVNVETFHHAIFNH